MPDDETLTQLLVDRDWPLARHSLPELRWPAAPLRGVLVRQLSQLDVARFAKKYPAVQVSLRVVLLDRN